MLELIGILLIVGLPLLVISWIAKNYTGFAGSSLFKTAFLFLLSGDRKQKDSAKFLDKADSKKLINPFNRGLLIDGSFRRISEQNSFEHLGIVSRTGGGKSSRFVIPNLLTLDDCSIVVTDLSGELFKSTSGYLASKGFDIKAINLGDTKASLGYNPLSKIESYTDASEISHILVKSANPNEKDTFWTKGAERIITILIECLRSTKNERHINLANLKHLLNNFSEDGSPIEDFIMHKAADNIFEEYKGFRTGNTKVMLTFISVAINSLDTLNDPNIASITSINDINFADLRKRKTALYIIVPQEKLQFYSFILNLFYTQLFNYCLGGLEKNRSLPIYFLLDEFGHLAIPNFSTIITTIRKYKVSISVILQSISQLETRYGKAEANTIFNGGLASKIFYSGGDLETVSMLEKILGKVKYSTKTLSGDVSRREENLMNADRIRTLEDNEAIYLFANKEPVLMKVEPYYRIGRFKSRSKMKPFNLKRASRQEIQYVNL